LYIKKRLGHSLKMAL